MTNPDRTVHGREACAAIVLTVVVIALVIGVAILVAP